MHVALSISNFSTFKVERPSVAFVEYRNELGKGIKAVLIIIILVCRYFISAGTEGEVLISTSSSAHH